MAEAKATTLILVTNTVAGRQWKRELLARTSLTEEEIGEYSGERKEIRPVTIATYQVITTRRKGEYRHLDLFDAQDWGLIVYDEVHLLPAPIFRLTADLQSRRRLGLTATLVREDGREDDVFSLIGPKRYDAPWQDIEAQGWIAPAECIEVRVSLDDEERMTYAVAEPEERYRIAATAQSKLPVIRRVLERHPDEPGRWSSAPTSTSSRSSARALDAPVIQGSTTNKERERLFDAFRTGEIRVLVVSKVANFSIDLPEAAVAVQVSGTFGSRQEEAQRLGRVLRPKADGRQAHFYTVVSPRHPRQRVRRPPAALPRRAGLRVHDRRRRRPGRPGRGQRPRLGGRARRLSPAVQWTRSSGRELHPRQRHRRPHRARRSRSAGSPAGARTSTAARGARGRVPADVGAEAAQLPGERRVVVVQAVALADVEVDRDPRRGERVRATAERCVLWPPAAATRDGMRRRELQGVPAAEGDPADGAAAALGDACATGGRRRASARRRRSRRSSSSRCRRPVNFGPPSTSTSSIGPTAPDARASSMSCRTPSSRKKLTVSEPPCSR